MPWSAPIFRARHNKRLAPRKAAKAAAIANAILKRTGDEGLAIATANKRVETITGHRAMTRPDLIRKARTLG